MNYTYIIKCADSTLYTGWTNDLDKRIKAHNSGKVRIPEAVQRKAQQMRVPLMRKTNQTEPE